MSLLDTLNADLKTAMKTGDEPAKRALRGVKAAITRAEKDKGNQSLTDDEIIAVLRKQAKQRQDSIDAYHQAGRQDLVQEEEAELAVIERYLPQLMSEDAIREIAQQVIAEVGATGPRDMGKVMGRLMAQLKGKADGRLVNQIVRDLLSA
ncbi:MAG TPA: GatB/YqeY domain-containing protein [Anaerolineae bacterium]|nr:GatB/YqeY domain-containing protein [Caldilineae bacterium]HID34874.1 GatB/YqeY domain-containing protein [Anaerolineae bacterium]HIQ12511.1 GatB/YqeY domain-containing protein [Caldilineales bacterium]